MPSGPSLTALKKRPAHEQEHVEKSSSAKRSKSTSSSSKSRVEISKSKTIDVEKSDLEVEEQKQIRNFEARQKSRCEELKKLQNVLSEDELRVMSLFCIPLECLNFIRTQVLPLLLEAVKTRRIQESSTVTFDELVGHSLAPLDLETISTIAAALLIRLRYHQ